MNRRKFFRQTAYAGLTLSAWLNSACTPAKKEPAPPIEGTDPAGVPDEVTLEGLQNKMISGAYTSLSITSHYLHRIESIDRNGAQLNSIIELNPDALVIAAERDQERKEGKVRGPLHGIPIVIKDNINTGDRMMTTAGSLALEGNIASADAFIVSKLREAGAVILGKTNLSEWANFRSSRSVSGWSSRGGQTRNPYSLDRNPCGSSSGTGVAVSANLCAIGIGTETNGSISCPASVNGIVGIKPTVGLWSRSGIIPISKTQDTAGPMARTVRDAAILLGALAGFDPTDSYTLSSKDNAVIDYTTFLHAEGLKGKRIGVEKSLLKVHEGVDALLLNALGQLKSRGATIVEVNLLNTLKDLDDEEGIVLRYEFKDGLNRYLASAKANVKSLQDVILFNQQNESRAMPYFKQEILESSEKSGSLDSKEYKAALDKLLRITRGSIDKVLRENHLDALCGPANGPSWCTDPVNGDAGASFEFYSPAAVAGYPSITVPMGEVFGLPVGIVFFGTAFTEPDLLTIAYGYEQASHNRVAPAFKKAVTA